MSSERIPEQYSDAMWTTFITEAIQTGDFAEYCKQHHISYRTFKRKYAEYMESADKKNSSPKPKRRCKGPGNVEPQVINVYISGVINAPLTINIGCNVLNLPGKIQLISDARSNIFTSTDSDTMNNTDTIVELD